MVLILKDKYTKSGHEGEIQVTIERLNSQGYSVSNIRRVSRMILLFGTNITEIYYAKKENR